MTDGWPFRWGKRTYVMGVVNVTPDSFSGDGIYADPEAAARLARQQQIDGADIIDVGGESSRPGSRAVPLEEELNRIVPAVRAIKEAVDIPISIDTIKARVACAAVENGASVVNDVSGLAGDPDMLRLLAGSHVAVVVVHSRRRSSGENVAEDVIAFLSTAVERALKHGIRRDQLMVDPGFGFAKSPRENLELLRRLKELTVLELPILVGQSRKETIGKVLNLPIEDRLEGTMATVALAIANGADMVRVHDVRVGVRVARMADAVVRGWDSGASE